MIYVDVIEHDKEVCKVYSDEGYLELKHFIEKCGYYRRKANFYSSNGVWYIQARCEERDAFKRNGAVYKAFHLHLKEIESGFYQLRLF